MNNKVKQVIVWNNALKVRKGKLASQVSHASMLFIIDTLKSLDDFEKGETIFDFFSEEEADWMFNGKFTKIVCGVDSEQELLDLYDQAKASGLTVHKVVDSGDTEFHGVPTLTAIAIGPHKSSLIDTLTKDLKLI